MKPNKQIWFLADIVERSEDPNKINTSPNRRCLTWVNTLLVSASSLSKAYDKAMKIAKKRYSDRYVAAAGNMVEWKVIGLSSLQPIDEELEDGSEIFWIDKGYISAKHSSSMIKSKFEITTDISIKRRVRFLTESARKLP
jgi:hypothetical protein